MKSLKLKSCHGENVADFFDEILVDAERLESDGSSKHEHFKYITHIFEHTSNYILSLSDIQNNK